MLPFKSPITKSTIVSKSTSRVLREKRDAYRTVRIIVQANPWGMDARRGFTARVISSISGCTLRRTRNHGALRGTYRRIADFAIVFRADMPSARFREPRGNSRWRASRILFGGDLCTVSSRASLALNTFSIRSCLKYPTLKDRTISTADRITKRTMQ